MDLIKISNEQILCIITEQDEKYFNYNNESEKRQCVKNFIAEVKERALYELDFDMINEPYSVSRPEHKIYHYVFTKKSQNKGNIIDFETAKRKRRK